MSGPPLCNVMYAVACEYSLNGKLSHLWHLAEQINNLDWLRIHYTAFWGVRISCGVTVAGTLSQCCISLVISCLRVSGELSIWGWLSWITINGPIYIYYQNENRVTTSPGSCKRCQACVWSRLLGVLLQVVIGYNAEVIGWGIQLPKTLAPLIWPFDSMTVCVTIKVTALPQEAIGSRGPASRSEQLGRAMENHGLRGGGEP